MGRKQSRIVVNGWLPCTKCGQTLPVQAFGTDTRRPCGYRSHCELCRGRACNVLKGIKRGCRKSPLVTDGEKWCYACREVKGLDAYRKNRRMKDGYASECNACSKRLAVARYRRRQAIELSKATNASIDEAVHHIHQPRSPATKPAKVKAIIEPFKCLNCGKTSSRKGRKYCSEKCSDLVSWRVQKHVRRARKRGVEREVIDLPTLLVRDKFKCGICYRKIKVGLQYPHPLSASMDHIIPLSRGGSHTWMNVQASHHACNQLKRTQAMGQLRIC